LVYWDELIFVEHEMEYDTDAVDDATLALMFLTLAHNGTATWKGYSWEVTDRLYEKGYLGNPANKSKSILMTPEGMQRCEQLFQSMFGIKRVS